MGFNLYPITMLVNNKNKVKSLNQKFENETVLGIKGGGDKCRERPEAYAHHKHPVLLLPSGPDKI